MKVCKKCGQRKPRTDFYGDKGTSDGLRGKCKECMRHYTLARKRTKHAEICEKNRAFNKTEKRRTANKKHLEKHIALYPDRFHARKLLHREIRAGRMVREPCWKCGNPKSHGHHHDYSKPLDVEWLCALCHGREHGQYEDAPPQSGDCGNESGR